MSSSRLHIPFPHNFLSLNTPTKKANDAVLIVRSPESELSHNFLSNRPHPVPRHSSVSSVDSVESSTSTASSPSPGEHAASPVLRPTLPAFLALNTKHAASPASAEVVKSPFLSNRG